MSKIRLPNSRQRIAIVGRTGSGKTFAAAWHLSRQKIEKMPWVIFDYKGDDLLNKIPRAQHIGLEVPTKPGVYITHPLPNDTEAVENYLWKLWRRERVGIYVDEGYMIGDTPAFNALLTQGRSKHIPMIILSQRPVWMSRFVFSEADYYQVFHLNDIRDRKTIQAFCPADLNVRLPDYHSHFYDVGRNALHRFAPVPAEGEILESFSEKLQPRRKFL